MDHKLDEAAGRQELGAIADELKVARTRMRALLARVRRTRGFQRSRRALGVSVDARMSLPFLWAGHLEVAVESVTDAIVELRMGARKRRR